MSYGIGYKYNNILQEINNMQITLKPFETKIIKLVVFNDEPTGDVVDINISVEEILDITEVKVSSIYTNPNTWSNIASVLQVEKEHDLFVYVKNKYYCESLVNIILEYKQYKAPSTTMSYYGDLTKDDTKDIYYLPKEIEIKSKRVITIDPVPEGKTYTYLSYSNGNNLVLLDNKSAIIVDK